MTRARFNNSQLNIAVNQATNTIYATNITGFNTGNLVDNGVYVINGAVCDAAEHDRMRPDARDHRRRAELIDGFGALHHPLGDRRRPGHGHHLRHPPGISGLRRQRVGHQRRHL